MHGVEAGADAGTNSSTVSVVDVSFGYTSRFHLGPLSLELPDGSCLGVLGPNGAGKSTLLRLLAGHLAPHGGSVRVCGRDPFGLPGRSGRRGIALASEPPLYAEHLRVDSLRRFAQRNFGLGGRIGTGKLASRKLQLGSDLYRRRVGELSTGQKQQLQLELAFAAEPRLLLLDEPYHGLDLRMREQLSHAIGDFVLEPGRCAVLCTHVTGDLERMASHLLLLRNGRPVLFGQTEELLEQVCEVRVQAAERERLRVPEDQLLAERERNGELQLVFRDRRGLEFGDREWRPLDLGELYRACCYSEEVGG